MNSCIHMYVYLASCIPAVKIHSKKVVFSRKKNPNLRFAVSITKLIIRDQENNNKKTRRTGTDTSFSFSSVLKEKSATDCQTGFLKPYACLLDQDSLKIYMKNA